MLACKTMLDAHELFGAPVLVYSGISIFAHLDDMPSIETSITTHSMANDSCIALIHPENSEIYQIFYCHSQQVFIRHISDKNAVFLLHPKFYLLSALIPNNSTVMCICWRNNVNDQLNLGLYDLLRLDGTCMKHLSILQRHIKLHEVISVNHDLVKNDERYIEQQNHAKYFVHWIGYEKACIETFLHARHNLQFKPSCILRLDTDTDRYQKVILPLHVPEYENNASMVQYNANDESLYHNSKSNQAYRTEDDQYDMLSNQEQVFDDGCESSRDLF